MATEKGKELTVIKDISEITSKHVLSWAKRMERQESQKAILESLNETKDFDMLRKLSKISVKALHSSQNNAQENTDTMEVSTCQDSNQHMKNM